MLMEYLGFGMTSWLAMGVVVLLLWLTSRKTRGLPPGPSLCFPILGHLPLMRGDPRDVFKAMRKKYGDIFHLYMGSKPVVVLNGYDVMKEALVTNGDVFSDRPRSFLVEVLLKNKGIAGSSGQQWKEQRKFALTALKEFGFGKNILQEKILEELSVFTEAMAQEQGQAFVVKEFVQNAISNVVCNIVFGKRFDYGNPTFVSFLEIMDMLVANMSNTGLVDFIPILRFFPGDPANAEKCRAGFECIKDLLVKPEIEKHLKTFDPSRPCENFIQAYIREIKKQEAAGATTTLNYSNMVQTVLDLFVAGTETTATTLRWSLVYLLNFPQLQERLHEEIQDKIGDRPPKIEDREEMPLVNAFMMEVLRHADIAPMSLAHATSQDTVFRGYFIPKGTMVIPFLDSALKDPAVWKNPDQFDPDHFLQNGKFVNFEDLVPFSLGRRVCLGETLARMEFFLFLVTMVQRFRFVSPENCPLPELQGDVGLVHSPHVFKVKAMPRV